jgi:hypothetical protein
VFRKVEIDHDLVELFSQIFCHGDTDVKAKGMVLAFGFSDELARAIAGNF